MNDISRERLLVNDKSVALKIVSEDFTWSDDENKHCVDYLYNHNLISCVSCEYFHGGVQAELPFRKIDKSSKDLNNNELLHCDYEELSSIHEPRNSERPSLSSSNSKSFLVGEEAQRSCTLQACEERVSTISEQTIALISRSITVGDEFYEDVYFKSSTVIHEVKNEIESSLSPDTSVLDNHVITDISENRVTSNVPESDCKLKNEYLNSLTNDDVITLNNSVEAEVSEGKWRE